MQFEGNQLDYCIYYTHLLFPYVFVGGRGADFIDTLRTNSKRLLIVLYSNQFYNTVGSLVFSTPMFDYGKIPSVLQISTMQICLPYFNLSNNCSSFGCAGLTGKILNIFWLRNQSGYISMCACLFLTLYRLCYDGSEHIQSG